MIDILTYPKNEKNGTILTYPYNYFNNNIIIIILRYTEMPCSIYSVN
jgi:hypothetical protein